MRRIIFSYTMLLLLTPSPLQADELKPKWEVGGALGTASMPQYMGSNESYQLAILIPYFIYRGDRLHVNRGGIHAELI